ncbi:hypothetical protein BHM03_00061130 [Ensete ventricosum]|nr:hypothetical protein BHM03_00061130 [Ensete ventricosum]
MRCCTTPYGPKVLVEPTPVPDDVMRRAHAAVATCWSYLCKVDHTYARLAKPMPGRRNVRTAMGFNYKYPCYGSGMLRIEALGVGVRHPIASPVGAILYSGGCRGGSSPRGCTAGGCPPTNSSAPSGATRAG